jgi:hypothetical protein
VESEKFQPDEREKGRWILNVSASDIGAGPISAPASGWRVRVGVVGCGVWILSFLTCIEFPFQRILFISEGYILFMVFLHLEESPSLLYTLELSYYI